jgi:hypothetical protein
MGLQHTVMFTIIDTIFLLRCTPLNSAVEIISIIFLIISFIFFFGFCWSVLERDLVQLPPTVKSHLSLVLTFIYYSSVDGNVLHMTTNCC